jgi:hypothetical protein
VACRKESTVASDGRMMAGSLAVDFSAGLAGVAGDFKDGAVCAATSDASDEDKARTTIRTE